MAKESARRRSVTDSELGSVSSARGPISAVLCPAVCALLVLAVFAISFFGALLAYDKYYDAFCVNRRFDVGKLYVFPNPNITFVKY